MLRKLSLLISACALAVAGGCGDDGNDETSAKPAVTTGTQEATAGLERLLLARNEEPGYQPRGPSEKLSTAEEYAARVGLFCVRGRPRLAGDPMESAGHYTAATQTAAD